MSPLSSTVASAQAVQPALCTLPAAEPVTFRHAPTGDVGQRLTDEQRELAIIRAGQAIERHMSAYQALEQVHNLTGCFADMGEADRQLRMAHQAKDLMGALIRGRSKSQVLALEIKAGLL